MRVVSMVPLRQLRRLESALEEVGDIVNCVSESECAALVREHRPHVLVVDPPLLQNATLFQFVRSENRQGLPVVLYTAFSPQDVGLALGAMKDLEAEMLLADVDDTNTHVRELLLDLPKRAAHAEVFNRVAERIDTAPPPVAAVLVGILLDPQSRAIKQLPKRLGIGRRTVDRALQLAGLPPLNTWYSVARLARAFEVADAGGTRTDAARAAGYETVRSLRRCARRFLGPGGNAFQEWARDEFLERAVAPLLAG